MTLRRWFTAGVLLPAGILFAACDSGPSGPGRPDPDTSFNMTLETVYLVQTVQTIYGSVPLIAGREAYLRVFPRANEANSARPILRVRIYDGETLKSTQEIAFPGSSVPTAISQGETRGNWNIHLPASLVTENLAIEVELDPDGVYGESTLTDNRFPATQGSFDVDVRVTSPLRLRLVPIHQAANGLQGRVHLGNVQQFIGMARKIMPFAEIDVDLGEPFTVDTPPFTAEPDVWATVVNQLDVARLAANPDAYYYGVVQLPDGHSGVVGIANGIDGRTALGWDRFPDAPNTLAHELGHNFGRLHAPCGGAAGQDPSYPYTTGFIGNFGMDPATGELKTPSGFTDIMGYCDSKWWISDYTFKAILDHRARVDPIGAVASRTTRRSLIVWGRIADGELVLEPAFSVVTSPSLPARPGPYRLTGEDAGGTEVFSLSFAPNRLGDVPGDHRTFAFAVPLDGPAIERLTAIRLSGGGRSVTARASPLAFERSNPGGVPGEIRIVSRTADTLEARWDGRQWPLAVLRDPVSGDVLGLGRGGTARVATGSTDVEVILSDGVRSVAQRVNVR